MTLNLFRLKPLSEKVRPHKERIEKKEIKKERKKDKTKKHIKKERRKQKKKYNSFINSCPDIKLQLVLEKYMHYPAEIVNTCIIGVNGCYLLNQYSLYQLLGKGL